MQLKIAGRLLLIALSVLLVLTASVSWWALERVNHLAGEAAIEGQRIDHLLMTAAKVQTDFQVQIQEFKNILLRAEDVELYKKHYAAFKSRQDDVQAGLDEMSSALQAVGMDAGPTESLLLAHSELSFRYAEAAKLVKGMGLQAASEADKNVRGIDRQTSQGLRALRESIDAYAAERVAYRRSEIASTSEMARWAMGGVTLLGGLAMLLAVRFGLRQLIRQLGGEPRAAISAFEQMAQGHLNTSVGEPPAGSLLAALGKMQQALLERLTAEREVAAETARIKQALDQAGASVMLLDEAGVIHYFNHAMAALPVIGQRLAQGQHLPDLFPPALQTQVRGLLQQESHDGFSLAVGAQTFLLRMKPVFSLDAGNLIGRVLEWQVMTEALLAEQEIEALLLAAQAGDFSRRIPLQGKVGFYRKSAEGLNALGAGVEEALNELHRVLDALAHGDLTQQMQHAYQGTLATLKENANSTVDRLKEMILQLQTTAQTIHQAAQEVATGSLDISRRSEAQAASLEETASSMEELNATIRQNAENTGLAQQLAEVSCEIAVSSGQRMSAVIERMHDIDQSARRIEAIIGVIDGIAFQTNILALNAAVEAARAGEQGRGFAVVAGEVRSLAQRSALAAQEIKSLIAGSVSQVSCGVSEVSDVGQSIAQVVADFQRLTALVKEIDHATREQSQGVEQVTQAIGQMDGATQQSAARVQQAARSADAMREEANALNATISRFRLPTEVLRPALPETMPVTGKYLPRAG